MAKGYWIGHTEIHDVEAYKEYQAANAVAFAKYGGRFLVRGGRQEVKEGTAKVRSVIIEFPSYQAAVDCYDSPEYEVAKAIRTPISDIDLTIVEGYDI